MEMTTKQANEMRKILENLKNKNKIIYVHEVMDIISLGTDGINVKIPLIIDNIDEIIDNFNNNVFFDVDYMYPDKKISEKDIYDAIDDCIENDNELFGFKFNGNIRNLTLEDH